MKRDGRPLETMARLGYGSRGLVYLIVGGFAVLAALGQGGGTTGSRGALVSILSAPFGWVLLALVALGLFSYSAWRFLQAGADADHRGSEPKALVARAAIGLSGLINIGLAMFAISLLIGFAASSGGEDRSAPDWTAWLLAQPFGRWLVAVVGAGVIGAGFAMFAKAWTAKFKKWLACGGDVARWVVPLGRAGYVARGLVFFLIGAFLLFAAWSADASEVRGLAGAMRFIQGQPYGWLLFGVTALGLAAFGAFGFVQALYRRIDVPDVDVPAIGP